MPLERSLCSCDSGTWGTSTVCFLPVSGSQLGSPGMQPGCDTSCFDLASAARPDLFCSLSVARPEFYNGAMRVKQWNRKEIVSESFWNCFFFFFSLHLHILILRICFLRNWILAILCVFSARIISRLWLTLKCTLNSVYVSNTLVWDGVDRILHTLCPNVLGSATWFCQKAKYY